VNSEVVAIIDRADGRERVVIHRFIRPHLRGLGYRIDLERRWGSRWMPDSRWPTDYPDSLDMTLECAAIHVAWLHEEHRGDAAP
jgi:hypothetical protein